MTQDLPAQLRLLADQLRTAQPLDHAQTKSLMHKAETLLAQAQKSPDRKKLLDDLRPVIAALEKMVQTTEDQIAAMKDQRR